MKSIFNLCQVHQGISFRKNALVLLIALGVAGPVIYIGSQRPRFSFTAENVSLMLTKGYYRSWSLRFSDGWQFDRNGKARSVVIDEEHRTMCYGYRWWPVYGHCDMEKFFALHPELTEIKLAR